ncbi:MULTISPECIES: glycosyltransferase [unclassified Bradyrhizobium]|uniref:glycosyltransferase n=1 Tax=unclassified Bradyrhizobium TaxID=2631580 RepID=UPI0028EEAE39|nr:MULTISPECIES: glycosyltransferase [unclassified Bradyrhizobium]
MQKLINLAIFIDDLGVGGTQNWLTLLVPALAARGFAVRVYGMRAIAHPEILERLAPYAEVQIIGEGRLWAGPGLLRLAQELRTWPAQVVQTALPTSDMIGRLLAWLTGVPAVFSTIRGRNVDKPSWQRWLDRRTAHLARAVVFNDREAVPFAIRHEGIRAGQVVYIPNGVSITTARRPPGDVRRELQTSAEATVLATVARLHPSKGQQYLLRAFRLVRERYPGAVLWLVGDGECRAALEREADELGITTFVRFAGTRRDVRDILDAVDLFALPSLWEGMPNALMEAMAASRPVVASDVDAIRELVIHGKTGWMVRPGDADALARCMMDILADPARAADIGQAGLRHVREHFSLDGMADAYATLYRDGLKDAALRVGAPLR